MRWRSASVATTELMLMMLPPLRAEVLDGFLSREDQAEDIEIELLVEVLGSHGLERGEFVDAGVVHQDIDPAERLLGFREEPPHIDLRGQVRLHRDGLAVLAGDLVDDLLGPVLARRVVDDDRRALRGEFPGDLGPDPLRCSGHDGDFPGELLRDSGHDSRPFPAFRGFCVSVLVANCNWVGILEV